MSHHSTPPWAQYQMQPTEVHKKSNGSSPGHGRYFASYNNRSEFASLAHSFLRSVLHNDRHVRLTTFTYIKHCSWLLGGGGGGGGGGLASII